MKVLLIAHNPSVQGAGLALVNIAKALAANGVQVVAVVPGYKGVYELLENIDGVKRCVIRQIKNETFPSFTGLENQIKYIPRLIRQLIFRPIFKHKLQKLVKEEHPDLIHTNTGTIRISGKVAEAYKIPHIQHVRECQSIGYGFIPFGGEKAVTRLFKGNNNHCIAITKSVFDYYHLDKNKDCIIYDGVFSEIIVDNIKPIQKKQVILYVGLLSVKKGVKMLLEGFNKVADKIPDYELWLAGVDDIGVENYIKKTKCSDRIKYLGFRRDVYDLMSTAKVLVVASEYEGFGFITAEAMLNHTLVIGRNTAGTKEQMDNVRDIAGFEVALRFQTVNELSDRIIEATSMNEATYKSKTDTAFNAVTNLYTIEKNGREILRYYNSLLNNTRKQ